MVLSTSGLHERGQKRQKVPPGDKEGKGKAMADPSVVETNLPHIGRKEGFNEYIKDTHLIELNVGWVGPAKLTRILGVAS